MRALLPVTDGAEGEAELRRELLLRQPELLTHCFGINHAPRALQLLGRCWQAIRIPVGCRPCVGLRHTIELGPIGLGRVQRIKLEFRGSAFFLCGLARNHAFVDGNKRTAFAALVVFLVKNGVDLDLPQPETVQVILELAAGKLDETELAKWVGRYE